MKGRFRFHSRVALPLICAPMFLVTTEAMVVAACKAGVVGVCTRGNYRDHEGFEAGLERVVAALAAHLDEGGSTPIGPLAVNLAASGDDTDRTLATCRRLGVELLITALGHPGEVVKRAAEWDAAVYHDIINTRFAEKAIGAGVDGLIAVCWGGGGHSGTASPLVLIPRLREMFDGVIAMAGGVAHGSAIRAAQVLGADFAYAGTRFIATQESGAPEAYKAMLLDADIDDVAYSNAVNGSHAAWLLPSLAQHGLELANLAPTGLHRHDHLPENVRPWRDLWSAGQGVAFTHDIPTVADLVDRMAQEYRAATASA